MNILFTTGCPKCNMLKKKLKENKIPYEEDNDVEQLLELGFRELPVLKINDKYYDFNQAINYIKELK